MAVKLKQVEEQVIVITGATSGIGLVTSRMAARRGAKLVLASRNEKALRQLAAELEQRGSEAVFAVTDVGKERDVVRLGELAIRNFGRMDTWVNNAGVSIYGRLLEISLRDQRQLFETNFWGVVHGSRVAAKHLRRNGGALINLGSALSDRALPIQGIYVASKHAVKGYTDALRMELEEAGVPISVTLIKPAAIDTPYRQHAKNYMNVEPMNPPPVYAPDIVAKAILHAAECPERDIFIGAGGKGLSLAEKYAPRLTDKIMEKTTFKMQRSDRPARHHKPALYEPGQDLRERGGYPGHVAESSIYTLAVMSPLTATAAVLGAAVGIGSLVRYARTRNSDAA